MVLAFGSIHLKAVCFNLARINFILSLLFLICLEQRELTAELSSMPICNDTLRVRRRREELEQRLAKVEEAIKIFSRQKVFVKLD